MWSRREFEGEVRFEKEEGKNWGGTTAWVWMDKGEVQDKDRLYVFSLSQQAQMWLILRNKFLTV